MVEAVETAALLKLLALGDEEIATGRTRRMRDVIQRLKAETARARLP